MVSYCSAMVAFSNDDQGFHAWFNADGTLRSGLEFACTMGGEAEPDRGRASTTGSCKAFAPREER
jgi:hypothetical protein